MVTKILYVLLIVSCANLLAFGGVCLGMDHFSLDSSSRESSTYFAVVSFVVEVFAIIVGLMGIKLATKISMSIIIPSILMLTWSYLMYAQPSHISVDEVFLFWILYVLGMIFLSVLGFRAKKKTVQAEWDEDLLDDLLQ